MKKFAALILTLALVGSLTAPALAFSDVPASHSFHDAIAACSASGIVGGYEDGTFRPANTVTKSNFAVMLSRAFFAGEIAKYNDDPYNRDIYGPFAGNYLAAYYNGAFEGASFYSDFVMCRLDTMSTPINRYDMAQLLANIMKTKGVSVNDAEKSAAAAKLADYSTIPSQYRDAVASAAAKGLIGGYSDGNFYGSRSMNRGQAAVVIYRLQALVPSQSGTQTPAPSTTPEPTPQPAPAPSQDPAVRTLTNGKPITEDNVTEILNQLQERYPNKTDFSKGYAGLGSGRIPSQNCIDQITRDYTRAPNQFGSSTLLSTTAGCGGWAAFVADEIFGQTNVTWKKTTMENARPGDLMILLDLDGYLKHVQIYVGESTDGLPKTIEVYVASAGTNSSGVYHIGWGNSTTNPNVESIDVYTAYPD